MPLTGQRLGNSDGLLYFGARFYDAALSYFLAADTIAPDRGVFNDPRYPLTATGYVQRVTYVRNAFADTKSTASFYFGVVGR